MKDNTQPGTKTPLLLNVPDAASALGISKWTIYELMHRGLLRSVKIQSRRFITQSDLTEYVDSLRLEGEHHHGL
jgi:excisionase family DNA binding protein